MSTKPNKHPERKEKHAQAQQRAAELKANPQDADAVAAQVRQERKERKEDTKNKREAKIEAARIKEEERKHKEARKENLKRAGIVIVCIVLVLALGIPTVALSVLGLGG